ncbi:MAG: hypothetical protein OEY97_12130 [Nitrospirota bacterium]|nr:hypothetical protein [Nitrospirota bacterium]
MLNPGPSSPTQARVEVAPWGFRLTVRAADRKLPVIATALLAAGCLGVALNPLLATFMGVPGETLEPTFLVSWLVSGVFGMGALYCLWAWARLVTTREVLLADATGITSTITTFGRSRSLHYPMRDVNSLAACTVGHLPHNWYFGDRMGWIEPGGVLIFRYQGGYGASAIPFDMEQAADLAERITDRFGIGPQPPVNLPLSDPETDQLDGVQKYLGPGFEHLYESLRRILEDADLTLAAQDGPGFPYWYAYEAGTLMAMLPLCRAPEQVDAAIREAFRRCTDEAFDAYQRWETEGPDQQAADALPDPVFPMGYPADLGIWVWLAWTDSLEIARSWNSPEQALHDSPRVLTGRDETGPYGFPISGTTH